MSKRGGSRKRTPQCRREYNGPPEETQRFNDRLKWATDFWQSDIPQHSECGVSQSAWGGPTADLEEFFRPGKVRCGGGWHIMAKMSS